MIKKERKKKKLQKNQLGRQTTAELWVKKKYKEVSNSAQQKKTRVWKKLNKTKQGGCFFFSKESWLPLFFCRFLSRLAIHTYSIRRIRIDVRRWRKKELSQAKLSSASTRDSTPFPTSPTTAIANHKSTTKSPHLQNFYPRSDLARNSFANNPCGVCTLIWQYIHYTTASPWRWCATF